MKYGPHKIALAYKNTHSHSSLIDCVPRFRVCVRTYGATIVTQQRYKQCDIPALFVNLPRSRVKHTADRIMSGEHPQCIWCGEKGQGSDYTSIGVTVWCQNVSITCSETGASSIHKKLRDVCAQQTSEFERGRSEVCCFLLLLLLLFIFWVGADSVWS